MIRSKKNKDKPKLNLTVREEQRNKLEQMASLENRSVSNLIEVMALTAADLQERPRGRRPVQIGTLTQADETWSCDASRTCPRLERRAG